MEPSTRKPRPNFSRVGYVGVVCLIGMFTIGCGKSSEFEFAPVSGVITLDGEPLAHGSISFQPKGGGTGSFGRCDAEGRYVLESIDGDDGAVVATHRVAIYGPRSGGGSEDGEPAPREIVPQKYNYQTTLTLDVPPAGTSSADWNLESK